MSAFGSFGSLQSDGMRFGYNFYNSPVSVYGGFNSLKYDLGLASQFTPSALSGTSSGYSMQGGVEFRPSPNLSLSLGASFIQMQPGRKDSDDTSKALTGDSSGFDRVRGTLRCATCVLNAPAAWRRHARSAMERAQRSRSSAG